MEEKVHEWTSLLAATVQTAFPQRTLFWNHKSTQLVCFCVAQDSCLDKNLNPHHFFHHFHFKTLSFRTSFLSGRSRKPQWRPVYIRDIYQKADTGWFASYRFSEEYLRITPLVFLHIILCYTIIFGCIVLDYFWGLLNILRVYKTQSMFMLRIYSVLHR